VAAECNGTGCVREKHTGREYQCTHDHKGRHYVQLVHQWALILPLPPAHTAMSQIPNPPTKSLMVVILKGYKYSRRLVTHSIPLPCTPTQGQAHTELTHNHHQHKGSPKGHRHQNSGREAGTSSGRDEQCNKAERDNNLRCMLPAGRHA
jgi:hypothetical protein